MKKRRSVVQRLPASTKAVRRLGSILAAGVITIGAAEDSRADFTLRTVFAAPSASPTVIPAAATAPTATAAATLTTEKTDLATLVATAVRTSPALARARIDRALAKTDLGAAMGLDDWRADGSLVATSQGPDGIPAAADRVTAVGVEAGLSRSLPTGGTFSVQASGGVSVLSGDGDTGRVWDAAVAATLEHPLLRGRGRAIARADIGRAKLAADAAGLAAQREAVNAVQQVVAAYWDLVLAQRELEIRQSSLELANERLRRAQTALAAGSVAAAETVEIEQVVVTRAEAVLSAELGVAQRSLALRSLVGMPIGATAVGLRVEQALALADRDYQLDATLDASKKFSPELAELRVANARATIDVEVADNGLLPALSAALSLGPRGRGSSVGDAASNLVELDGFFVSGQVGISHDLGQRRATAARDRAKLSRARTQLSAVDIERQLGLAVASATSELTTSRRRAQLAEQTITLAQKNIAIEQTRYSLGKSTNFDVLTRQDELRDAELRLARIIVDWQKAEAVARALTGDLLRDFSIELDAR